MSYETILYEKQSAPSKASSRLFMLVGLGLCFLNQLIVLCVATTSNQLLRAPSFLIPFPF